MWTAAPLASPGLSRTLTGSSCWASASSAAPRGCSAAWPSTKRHAGLSRRPAGSCLLQTPCPQQQRALPAYHRYEAAPLLHEGLAGCPWSRSALGFYDCKQLTSAPSLRSDVQVASTLTWVVQSGAFLEPRKVLLAVQRLKANGSGLRVVPRGSVSFVKKRPQGNGMLFRAAQRPGRGLVRKAARADHRSAPGQSQRPLPGGETSRAARRAARHPGRPSCLPSGCHPCTQALPPPTPLSPAQKHLSSIRLCPSPAHPLPGEPLPAHLKPAQGAHCDTVGPVESGPGLKPVRHEANTTVF